jgi:hypothetical protein
MTRGSRASTEMRMDVGVHIAKEDVRDSFVINNEGE